MDKEYFTSINDVSRELDLPAYTLRYWEKQFPTVVRPVTGAGGRRYYRPETIERLRKIKDLLYEKGLTIAGVKKLIHNGDFIEMVPEVKVNDTRNKDIDLVINKKTAPVFESKDSGTDTTLFDITPPSVSKSIDTTKIDLAVGLLNKAIDLLE